MSKIQTIGTKIVCDVCGKTYETIEGFVSYNNDIDGSMIRLNADASGWIEINENDFCPNCYKFDHNDNVRIKDGRVYDGENYELIEGRDDQ
ncbi:MAG: hypothetical protein IKH61_13010 [Bacteroidales bacterium]|nr:hypothetical protein [Bacteroidales bacterium]